MIAKRVAERSEATGLVKNGVELVPFFHIYVNEWRSEIGDVAANQSLMYQVEMKHPRPLVQATG